jgi:hypothetical protein
MSLQSPLNQVNQPELLVGSEGYYYHLSCEQRLEGNLGKYDGGGSVTAEGGTWKE